MSNITVSISDASYHQARLWAAQRDTSVSAVLQYLLETLPGISRAVRTIPVRNPKSMSTAPGLPPATPNDDPATPKR